MASTIRQRLRRFNGTDYDTIHLETSADNVLYGSDTVKTSLDTIYNTKISKVIGPTGIASFNDGESNAVLNQCVVNIEPMQSGSGDPSPTNVRSISGWTEAKVSNSRKNLLKITGNSRTESGVTFIPDPDTGNVTVSGTATDLIYFFIGTVTLYPGTYVLSGHPGGITSCWLYDNTWTFLDDGNASTTTITETKTFNFYIRCTAGANFSTKTVFLPMLRLSAGTDAAFEPYRGNTYTISFGEAGTVYGGTLDVGTGILTVDRADKTVTGESSLYRTYENTTGFRLANLFERRWGERTCICDKLKRTSSVIYLNVPYRFAAGDNSSDCYFSLPSDVASTTSEANLWLANNPLHFVYELATPVAYQLTPTQVRTLLGLNNIYADCGDITVGYNGYI